MLGVRHFGVGGRCGAAPQFPSPCPRWAGSGSGLSPRLLPRARQLSHGPAAASAAQVSSCHRQPRQAAGPCGAAWGSARPRGCRGACVGRVPNPVLCRARRRPRGCAHLGTAPCAPGTLLHRLPRLGSFPPPSPSPRGPRGVQGGGRPPRWPRCRDVGHPTRCCWPPERGAQGLCSRRHRWPWRALLLAWLSLGCGIGTAQVRARGHPRAGPTVPPQPPPQTPPSSTQGSAPEVLVQGPEPPARARPRRQLARGTWGPWGPWSACSSSCGDGVAFRARRCLR